MKKTLLICCLLAGHALPSFSQARDTAFAVRKLFRIKRGGGEGMAATGATVAATETIGYNSRNRSAGANMAAAVVSGGVPLLLGLEKASRFSREREELILKTYAEGWPIPADVRRKLRRKHFHRSTKDVLGR